MGCNSRRAERVAELAEAKDILCKVPNVGPATAKDLLRLGIESLEALAEADPRELYSRLAEMDGRAHDPCVLDVLTAAVAFARDGTVKPWWHYTKLRTQAAEALPAP